MSEIKSPSFGCYIGIDYSGAETPTSSLKGLRVYLADRAGQPKDVVVRFFIKKPYITQYQAH